MRSKACNPLVRQGYHFFSPASSAALKPCMWTVRALRGGETCYKQRFYGIESHRCVQMTPTLKCNQRCLFCWRSMEHEVTEEEEIDPAAILAGIHRLQKKGLSGHKISPLVTPEKWDEAMRPANIAISLSGEPTCYSRLPELVDMLGDAGFSTFLVSNGTRPHVLSDCRPFQLYVSLDAPDEAVYRKLCRPVEDTWEQVQESLSLLGTRRSAIRITLVAGWNDAAPERYARMIQDSGARYVEVKGYMHVGYSRLRLSRDCMPDHARVAAFAQSIAKYCDYTCIDESPVSRVVCLERRDI
ncbi:MAG: 4-demethylwyosine synthase TYW1 [Methanomicrobiales archaeon]|nr:4-demethylwyosine synthase TYW1 [Methanomicrobiales archaeon]